MSTICYIILGLCFFVLLSIIDNVSELYQLNRNAKYLYRELAYFKGYHSGVSDALNGRPASPNPKWSGAPDYVNRQITDQDYIRTI